MTTAIPLDVNDWAFADICADNYNGPLMSVAESVNIALSDAP